MSENQEMVISLPLDSYGLKDGEPGDEFHPSLRQFLLTIATLGWWPLDFGDGNEAGTHVDLHFMYSDALIAKKQAQHFIDVRGDV